MWATLGTFLLGLTGSLVPRVLTALGLAFISYEAFSTLAESFINHVQASYNLINPAILQLINMAGFGTAISIISSALITRVSLQAVTKLGSKLSREAFTV